MKILVVDDDATSRFLLQEILAPYGEIDVCMDGAEALQAFQRSLDQNCVYDLICLDIMMPYASGVEVLKIIGQVRGHPDRSVHTKIVMTTALNNPETVVEAFREQCDGYVVKPIRRADLLSQLRSLELID